MTFNVYTLSDITKWKNILEELPQDKKDIFFLPEYYQTFIEHEKAIPYCFTYKNQDILIVYSFFKKKIYEFDLGVDYFDIYSPYGYGGVLSNVEIIPQAIINDFNLTFQEWCNSNNIIAELIRCYPLLPKQTNFLRSAHYIEVRTNAYIILSPSYSIPSSGAKQSIRTAKNKGLYSFLDNELTNIDKFQKLYNESIQRLQMDPYYHFPDIYYQNIKQHLANSSKLLFIKNKKNEIIAGCLIFHHQDRFHYRLSAFDFNYRNLNPNDLLINELIDLAAKENKKIITLGGGLGVDTNDSLFQFKKKYGNEFKTVYIGKKILNQKKYNEVCALWENKKSDDVKFQYQNFLLKYRY